MMNFSTFFLDFDTLLLILEYHIGIFREFNNALNNEKINLGADISILLN